MSLAGAKPRIAIVGDGPAGSALGIYLARAGVPCCLFSAGQRPELVVGESLVPAIVPLLRELGLEEEIKSYSTFKPGASFFLHPERETTINFARAGANNYAYNVPRQLFDQTLLRATETSGCQIIRAKAKLSAPGNDQLALEADSLTAAQAALGGTPDLIVDASGRNRLSARLLDIGEAVGKRRDTALFAHLEGVELLRPGNIHINRLRHGWSWRIPLPGRTSVGVVLASEHRAKWGATAEEQYDALLRDDPILSRYTGQAQRLTGVMKYNNYQLTSARLYGPNWVAVGDAAGFIDPIFSSGLIVGLTGAKLLASAIISGASQAQLAFYQKVQRAQLAAWQSVVDSFYNGHLFGLMRASDIYAEKRFWGLLIPLLEKNIQPVFSGNLVARSLGFKLTKTLLASELAGKFGNRLRID